MSNSSMLKYLVVCLVLIYSVQSRTSPLGKEKEGFCPPTSGAGICVVRCNNDQSCPGRQKCCSNGCGHVCMHPTGGIKPSPDKCPKGKPLPNVFCGRGPTRQHCPQGYSCNVEPTDGFAVCCPDDNSATKCPKGKPLPNVFCGRGPARKDCPQGYSCNIEPTDGFAVCCPDDNRAKCDSGTVLANTRCGNHTGKCPSGYQCKYKYGICCPELKFCFHCCGPPPCCNTCGLPPPPPQKCPADPRSNATCYHFIKNCKDDSSCPKKKKCCKQGCSYKCLKAV